MGCQGMLGGCPIGHGAATGCQGTSGGCPVGRGVAAAPRAEARPCGPAAPGGCSPRCSRRCPRCAGTVGDSGVVKGGPWQHWDTPPPHACHPLLTQHLQSTGSGCLSQLQDSPGGGTRHGAEWDGMAQPPFHPSRGGACKEAPCTTFPLTPVLPPTPAGRALGDRRADGWLPPIPPNSVPITVASGQGSRPGHPPPAASLPAGRRAGRCPGWPKSR